MMKLMLSSSIIPLFALLVIFFQFSSSIALHEFQASVDLSGGLTGHGNNNVGGLMTLENNDVQNRRFIAETTTTNNSSLILAAKNTHRKDPLDNYKFYTGGWNITDKHYWASVIYTAVPFFIVAAVWFVVFGLVLICTCFYFCCCGRKPYGYSRFFYALSLILLILFTIVAIIGCAFLYDGQQKFHGSASKTLNYIVDQAVFIAGNVKNISSYLSVAGDIGVGNLKLPDKVVNDVNKVQAKIKNVASTVEDKSQDVSKQIKMVLDYVRLALIILASVMLGVACIGFLLSIFGLQCLVYTLIILGWILVALTFILSGVFLVLHNVVTDTCISMDQWSQNPVQHTTLDDLLPCVDKQTAKDMLTVSKEVTFQLVNILDTVLIVANTNATPNIPPPINYNQSGPLVPNLCNPFNMDLSNGTCTTGEVEFDTAPQVWKNYICQAQGKPGSQVCTSTGRLTPTMYTQMVAVRDLGFVLYHYGPFLVDLVDCTYARNTFKDFSVNICPGLMKNSKWIYVGLLVVSIAVMLSLIFWVVYARERRHRVYTRQHLSNT